MSTTNNNTADTSNPGSPATSSIKSRQLLALVRQQVALSTQLTGKVCEWAPDWADRMEMLFPDEMSDPATALLIEHSFRAGACVAAAVQSGGEAALPQARAEALRACQRTYTAYKEQERLDWEQEQERERQEQHQERDQPEPESFGARLIARVRGDQG